jgi:hypothetical protein
LKLAEVMVEKCYTKGSNNTQFYSNPALPIVSDLASSCEKKQSLDDFLAEFVGDEDENFTQNI